MSLPDTNRQLGGSLWIERRKLRTLKVGVQTQTFGAEVCNGAIITQLPVPPGNFSDLKGNWIAEGAQRRLSPACGIQNLLEDGARYLSAHRFSARRFLNSC